MDVLNMRVGFLGGGNISGCGDVCDFLEFFNYAKQLILNDNTKNGFYNFICERLYKRYVRYEDIDSTTECMEYIYTKVVQDNAKDSHILKVVKEIYCTFLESKRDTLRFMNLYNTYQPLRIIITTFPYCAIDVEDSLEKLDTWDGPPFWTRFYLKEFVDQGEPIPELPF